MEHKAAGGGEDTAIEHRRQLHLPARDAGDRLERDEIRHGFRAMAYLLPQRLQIGSKANAEAQAHRVDVVAAGLDERLVQRVELRQVVVIEIHHAAPFVPRHRLPVVGAGVARQHPRRRLVIGGSRVLHRAAGRHVNMAGPSDALRVGMGSQQLA